ncbi:RNA polymerase sigma factor [Micromonospora sp. NPDC047707]|uniref:RNA polymerase sigma factor n=1 Tax=Micromonospora sp. NPDC047707 TaxID=3154498 RepID=UPI003456991B
MTELFHRHGNDIYAYVCDRLGTDDAHDLVADVFLVAWRRLPAVRPGEERPWLFGVARRLMLEHRRLSATHAALQTRLEGIGEPRVAGMEAVVDERTRVAAALQELPEPDREVLLLRYWYDLNSKEAAKVLGCTTATLAVRLHRARRRFERVYEAGEQQDQQPALDKTFTIYARGQV